jgi:hypothetical protein
MAGRSPEPFTAGGRGYGGIILSLLLVAAALAPLLHLLTLTAANYYDAPYYDTWSLYYHVATFMNGDSSWGHYLFTQQVDSRPAVPRLLLFLVHRVSRDLSIDVVLNFISVVATAGATLLLLRKTNPGISWPALWAVGVLFNLNFFSLAQWVNWNWHDAVLSFLPNLFFALGWVVNTSSLPPLRRGLLVSLCCALSSFCFASGLFQWFVLLPLTVGLGRKEKIRLWSLHLSAALICFAFYFTGFKSAAKHNLAGGLSHLSRSVTYVFVWLGSSLSGGSLPVAAVWGAILLLTFLFLGFQCLRRWRIDGLQVGWLPWLSMGCYALISASVAALGRSHIGLEQALRSRYCTISQWLIIGIIGLSVTLLRQNWERNRAPERIAASLLALLAASFIWFQARHAMRSADEWSKFSERMHFEKQSFGLERKQPGQLWTFDHPNRELVLAAYKTMQKAGFLRDLFHSDKILDLLAAHKTGRWNDGELNFASCLPFRDIRCRGWSVGGDAEAGNRVLVLLIESGGKVLAVGDGPIDRRRPDVILHKRPSSLPLAGFDLQFQIPKMAPGVYHLAAFRYAKDERSYYPIGAPAELAIPR